MLVCSELSSGRNTILSFVSIVVVAFNLSPINFPETLWNVVRWSVLVHSGQMKKSRRRIAHIRVQQQLATRRSNYGLQRPQCAVKSLTKVLMFLLLSCGARGGDYPALFFEQFKEGLECDFLSLRDQHIEVALVVPAIRFTSCKLLLPCYSYNGQTFSSQMPTRSFAVMISIQIGILKR